MKPTGFVLFSLLLAACAGQRETVTGERLERAERQIELLCGDALREGRNPRTVEPDGQTSWIGKKFDWTEGFFPGTLWYMYQWTGDAVWETAARELQSTFEPHKDLSYHDLGFIFNCSYGHGFRLTGDSAMLRVMVDAGNSLAGRFDPTVGSIKSWDEDKGWQGTRGWLFPVIIDNMMNLELLFELTLLTGERRYADIAVAHANTTMKNHFRPDDSSWHVIDYDPLTGEVRGRHTAQGFADESSWARGQAWGVYGYTICYRYTHDPAYLDMACRIADYIIRYPGMPEDKVPYWDYDAPDVPDAPRDASAAAITASALIELDGYAPGHGYYDYASQVVNSLASPAYSAPVGENNHFILMHSVGSIPHNNEIDVPLNYADYYYIEALLRQLKIEKP